MVIESSIGDEPGEGERLTVLIVDDDARVRHGLRALIECDPEVAISGVTCNCSEALHYGLALKPSVVLFDLNSPQADADLDILRQLATERPVVVLSLRHNLQQAALDAGAAAFLETGATPDQLLNAIHAAVGSHRAHA
jgi:DNA-binding NarL/FixJ family response regulator